MSKLSTYLPVGTEYCEYVSFHLLPGLVLENDTYFIDGMMISKVSWNDFLLLEKNQFMDDLDGYFIGNSTLKGKSDRPTQDVDVNESPFFCIFMNSAYINASFDLEGDVCASQLVDLTRLSRAFWLFRDETVLDPLEHISYTRLGDQVLRKPRLFGRSYITDEGFNLVSNGQLKFISAATSKLKIFDNARNNSGLKIAESLFAQSFKGSLQSSIYSEFRVANLLAALSTLTSDNPSLVPEVSLRYGVDGELIVDGRNQVAHGEMLSDSDLYETQLRNLVRFMLCEGIAMSLEDPMYLSLENNALCKSCIDARHHGVERIATASTKFTSKRDFATGTTRAIPLRNLEVFHRENASWNSYSEMSVKKFL